MAAERRGARGFGYDPVFLPDGVSPPQTMAELSDAEKDRISHRGRAVRGAAGLGTGGGLMTAVTDSEVATLKRRTAALSLISNTTLILLKLIAGTITGSVAILTEAVHSSIDLVASIVAFFSVRKADEPADESHRYGHEKIENLAAAIEGILILVGSAAIGFEAIRHLVNHGRIASVGLGIGVIAISLVVNIGVSLRLRRAAAQTGSPALAGDAAHLGTDALTSAAVLIGLVLVEVTGAQWIDPVVALAVALVVVTTGVRLLSQASRVLVDEALPVEEVEAIRFEIEGFASRGVVGYHELRTRRAGARRYIDLHVQFRHGTSLETAHRLAHVLQDLIEARLHRTDVLIHLEPEDRVRPGEVLPAPEAGSADAQSGRQAPPTGPRRSSDQVDRGRQRDRERDHRVAVVALQQQDGHGDQAAEKGRQPARSGEIHADIVPAGEDGALQGHETPADSRKLRAPEAERRLSAGGTARMDAGGGLRPRYLAVRKPC